MSPAKKNILVKAALISEIEPPQKIADHHLGGVGGPQSQRFGARPEHEGRHREHQAQAPPNPNQIVAPFPAGHRRGLTEPDTA